MLPTGTKGNGLFELLVYDIGRPPNSGWRDVLLALDVQFGRAGGMDAETAQGVTKQAWYPDEKGGSHGDEVIRRANGRWGKRTGEIVRIIVKEDQVRGIAVADSVADHWEGLSRWIYRDPAYAASVKRRHRFESL